VITRKFRAGDNTEKISEKYLGKLFKEKFFAWNSGASALGGPWTLSTLPKHPIAAPLITVADKLHVITPCYY